MDFNKILEIATELKIPKSDIKSIKEYLEHEEWGIAFETLCSAIEYDKIDITHQIYLMIKEIGEYMHMDKNLWVVFKI